MHLQLCPLFSGSSGNCVYIGTEETKILIDAGMSGVKIKNELAQIGVKIEEIKGILVTHEHADHIKSVGILSRKYHIPVWANAGTWNAMSGKIGNVDPECRIVFETGVDFYIGELDIRPFATPHDAAESVGYAVTSGNKKVAVATDIGCIKNSWLNETEESDVLMLESNHDPNMLAAGSYPYELKRRIAGKYGHLSNDDAGKAAVELVKRGVHVIILSHLSHENNYPELAYQCVDYALREAQIIPGSDMILDIAKRDSHGELYSVGD